MKKLKPTPQYKKDYKRFRNNPKKKEKLFEILNLLQNEIPIPAKNKPHMLTGNYAGYMECHIEGDFLLIWFDPDTDRIDLVRLGSHYVKGRCFHFLSDSNNANCSILSMMRP